MRKLLDEECPHKYVLLLVKRKSDNPINMYYVSNVLINV